MELGAESTQPVTPEEQTDVGAQADETAGPTSTDDTATVDETPDSIDTEQDLEPTQPTEEAGEEPVTEEEAVEPVKNKELLPADDAAPITVTDATYKLELMAWNLAEDPEVALDGDFGLVYADLGKPEDFAGKDVAGKIALIKRGELAFVDKIANAKAKRREGCHCVQPEPWTYRCVAWGQFCLHSNL